MVACHGNFDGAHCIECGADADADRVRAAIENLPGAGGGNDGGGGAGGDKGSYPRCEALGCTGLCKPKIVFFGEKLGPRYHASRDKDFFMETDSRTADELAAAAAAKQQRSKKQIQVLVGSYDAEALREEGRAADELKKSKLVPSCACDLLLVMGTSLKVPPLFCGPRYLILLQICGGSDLAAAPPVLLQLSQCAPPNLARWRRSAGCPTACTGSDQECC